MKTSPQNYLRAVCACAALAASTAMAVPITITPGNPGNIGTDNVLFNDGALTHSGLLVQGNFSGAGAGFILDFTSTSGSGLLVGNGGQASISGGIGNDPFTNLSFQLENGATFTKAILNADATGAGHITFNVQYVLPAGVFNSAAFTLDSGGQNFFNIEAGDGALITKVTFSTSDTAFADASQMRLGGFAAADVQSVPDGGATVALLGLSLALLGFVKRKLSA
jgi:hypothetical protein